MRNFLLACLVLLFSNHFISAQTDGVSQMSLYNVHVEGATWLAVNSASVNFEGKFHSSESEKFHVYGRAGFGYADINSLVYWDGHNALGGILALTILTGAGDHHFEMVGGAFLGNFKSKNGSGIFAPDEDLGFKALPLIDVGYRFQKPESGFLFRAKVGTLGLGIGLGYGF